jgi:hypothetical protein
MAPDRSAQGDSTTDDVVAESALQLWSAAQTDFDPFDVPPQEWPESAVPIRDVDIAVDAHLDLDVVRDVLSRLDGISVVLGRDAGTYSVVRVIPADSSS